MRVDRNLLLLFAHGLRADVIGDTKAWPLRTPHLEQLAEGGLRVVAGSACPQAQGGMASLLTGLHARQYDSTANAAREQASHSFAHWLTEANYHVAGVGHVGPIRSALDESVLVENVAVVEPAHCAYWTMARGRGLTDALSDQRRRRLRSGPFDPHRLLLEPEEDVDGFIGQQAALMLERMPDDRPWALIVVFTGPGNDLPPPPLYADVVSAAAVKSPFVPVDLRTLDALGEPSYPRSMLQRLEPTAIGRLRADYLGRVSLLDYTVAQLRKALHARTDAGRTWTLATADHGHLLGEHGLIGAQSFLSPAVEVPLLLVPPTNRNHELNQVSVDGLVSTIDVAPTVAALACTDLPPCRIGRSLVPMLRGQTMPAGDQLANLSEFHDRLMLETERFKAVFNRANRACLGLYDLFNDPNEKHNLVDRPDAAKLLDPLRLRLADVLLPLRCATG
ncbi:sulfatase-like hydrolase/transferase [Phycisphaerales bacterium AB-hyl4]|uniref:Sulfatase-like hydrolase/transferase n=1 Tax=Natronomicrosphaera hydrolytica TaxID=3242702 RepID=A0ABV4U0Y2_9BACT